METPVRRHCLVNKDDKDLQVRGLWEVQGSLNLQANALGEELSEITCTECPQNVIGFCSLSTNAEAA